MLAKRILDVLISLGVLVLLFPVYAILGLLIRISLGRPVLFKQMRPGLFARPFFMYKFRTLTDKRDQNGELIADYEDAYSDLSDKTESLEEQVTNIRKELQREYAVV